MLIRLSAQQEAQLLEWSAALVAGEVAADVEPSGYRIEIQVAGPIGCWATAYAADARLELGEVDVTLEVGA